MVRLIPMGRLFIALMQISNRTMTPDVFNHWYEDVHIPEGIDFNISDLVLRYVNYTIGHPDPLSISYATRYLALWKIRSDYDQKTGKKMNFSSPTFPDGGKEKKHVTTWVDLNSTNWLPIQLVEGKTKKNHTAAYAILEKISPHKAGVDDLSQWYQEEHLKTLSYLPSFHRSTRYRTNRTDIIQYLAVHEIDRIDERLEELLYGTETAQDILGQANSSDISYWRLVRREGLPGETLNPTK